MGTATAAAPTHLRMLTALGGHDADHKPFSWSPQQVLEIGVDVDERFALALGDGERAQLLDADGKTVEPVVTDDRPASRETGTSRQAAKRERPAGAVGHVEDEAVTGNEVAERKAIERREQLEAQEAGPDAADARRADQQRGTPAKGGRRTSRPKGE